MVKPDSVTQYDFPRKCVIVDTWDCAVHDGSLQDRGFFEKPICYD